ncbi:MAG: hypothetical protein ACYTE3_19445 [Planctomycetota bacterium]
MPPVSVWKVWISTGTALLVAELGDQGLGGRLGPRPQYGQCVGGDNTNSIVVGGQARNQRGDCLVAFFLAQVGRCPGNPKAQRSVVDNGPVGPGHNVVRWLGDRRPRVRQHECENTANDQYKP